MRLTATDIAIIESIPPSAFSAIFKATDDKKKKKKAKDSKESSRIIESAGVLDSTEAVVDEADKKTLVEGPRMKVWLLTEGLGNMRDKNYYGRECIESAPPIFEGSVMMLNHLGYIDEENRPEGDVEKTVAYYRNCKAERVNTPDGLKYALTAEACFDATQEGLNAFEKAKTAVHFRDDFPASDKEYVGISVNAIGESEPRKMMVGGQELDVNYVMRFAEGSRGADMVTLPARGGSFRALVEDIYGARPNKEVKMKKLLKTLEASAKALKEAMALTDADLRQKKTLEAQKALDVAVKAVSEASLKPKGEANGQTTVTDGEEAEEAGMQHDPDNANCECEACKPTAEDESADVDGGEDSSHTITHKVVSKGKAAIAAAGKQEAERKELLKIAVEQLIAESGIDKKYFDIPALCAMSFREAKADIGKQRRMHESAVATVLAKVGNVSVSHRARESASGNDEGNDGNEAPNNSEFPLLSVAE